MSSRTKLNAPPSRAQKGMTMVELMVAVVISLIGTLVIFQVFQVNEGIRRETTNGADTQTSGLVALTTIERDLRTAGFAFNENQLIGCSIRIYDLKRTPNDVTPFPFVPVKITSNTGTTPDVLQVTFGSPSSSPAKVALKAAVLAASSSLPYTPDHSYGFNAGDVIVVWQPNSNCSMAEVTEVTASQLFHASGNYFNPATGQNKTARFNKPGGNGIGYGNTPPDIAQISNLGPNPVLNEYTVRNDAINTPHQNNQFVVNNLLAEVSSNIPIAEQIVQFKAEYGMDDGVTNGTVSPRDTAANDGIVDGFKTITPTNWYQVIAVRLAVVTRSMQPERPDPATGECNITPDWGDAAYPVVWARGPDAPQGHPIDVRTESNWRCYRYRVFETTVPLRNMLWKTGDV